MRTPLPASALAALLIPGVTPAAAQTSFDVGIQVATPVSSQFDAADAGVGGRIAWGPIARLAGAGGPAGPKGPALHVEAELNFYPRDFPNRRPFSRARVEGLFGVTAGVALDRFRPFARLRPGFVAMDEAPEPLVCILIYPPPIACSLASGRTLFALDAGGGVEIAVTRRTFVRLDAGDRMLSYPGPVMDTDRNVHRDAFISHEFRFATGVGLRF